MNDIATDTLFRPIEIGGLRLPNRIVMAPMTRCFSPGGVPGKNVAAYYRRRAEGGVGLIVTEGAWVPHWAASNDDSAPRFHGEDALAGWKHVADEVHAAGGRIAPQLWHVGLSRKPDVENLYVRRTDYSRAVSPSGILDIGNKVGEPVGEGEIEAIVAAYARAAADAERLGFDGVELHGAHGYLIDQFFWTETNRREDRYGGDQVARTRFAVEVVRAIRARVSRDFPVIFRFSQWKLQDYAARMLETPAVLEAFLAPLIDAGVDIFHCSQRRFWLPEFEGEGPMNLAGWTKKLTGKPTISVGSVGLDMEMVESLLVGGESRFTRLDELIEMMERGDFDMIAVGRALIANPDWPKLVESRRFDAIRPYSQALLADLS
ncbi:MAG TPA: NADH:flavin oxidoreductase [Sphingomonas sp.]|nr:NADH:flavin oxidoreductase [Sphingomonas sp.]